jgi:hypothetical protein
MTSARATVVTIVRTCVAQILLSMGPLVRDGRYSRGLCHDTCRPQYHENFRELCVSGVNRFPVIGPMYLTCNGSRSVKCLYTCMLIFSLNGSPMADPSSPTHAPTTIHSSKKYWCLLNIDVILKHNARSIYAITIIIMICLWQIRQELVTIWSYASWEIRTETHSPHTHRHVCMATGPEPKWKDWSDAFWEQCEDPRWHALTSLRNKPCTLLLLLSKWSLIWPLLQKMLTQLHHV